METNNIKDLTVKITPKELGDVTINLTMEDGKMKAVLTASNKNAYNIINSNLQDLSNKINNNDIKVQNFSLNLYQEDTTFFKDESERGQYREEKRRSNHTKIDSIQQDEIPISNSEYYSENNINMLA
nr:flagellar hook-length control protein FliK [Clostridium sp. cel8]